MSVTVLHVAAMSAVLLGLVGGQSLPAAHQVSGTYIDRLLTEFGSADGGNRELTPAGLQLLLETLGVSRHRRPPTGGHLTDHSDHEHAHRTPTHHGSGLKHRDGGDSRNVLGTSLLHEDDVHALNHDHDHGSDHSVQDHHPDHDHDHDHGSDHSVQAHHPDHDHADMEPRLQQPAEGLGQVNQSHGHDNSSGHIVHDHHPNHDHHRNSDLPSKGVSHDANAPGATAAADISPSRDTREARPQDGSAAEAGAVSADSCPDAAGLLEEFGLASEGALLPDSLALLCPALVYHAAADTCGSGAERTVQTPPPPPPPPASAAVPPPKLWLFAGLSVLAISLCGLAGVAVVPIMQRVVYRQLLQFLVALAVGTLAGDALLHLLPHALVPHGSGESDGHGHSHDHAEPAGQHGHLDAVLKGLVALIALVFFFAAERVIGILHATCTEAKHKKINKRLADMPGLSRQQTEMIERKLNSYRHSSGANHCFGDRDTLDVLARLNTSHEHDSCPMGDTDPDADNHNRTPDCGTGHRTEQPATAPSCGSKPAGHSHRPSQQVAPDGEPGPSAGDTCERFEAEEPVAHSSDFTVIIHEHEHRHHGHTHTHGHIHQPAGSAVAVAGMVIVGDGLHNFTDGMAIGAAFAAGLASGLSTSVAVFCHELPHEIGDFAVLLQSGMSVRQALFYNVVSSVLCLLGMVIGMVLGNMADFSSWVFAGAAGSFLYIALVDMVPELTAGAGEAGSTPCGQLVLQLAGMSCGAAIMLTIAVYENELHSLITVL